MTSDIGKRVVQFGALPGDLTDKLVDLGFGATKGLRPAGGHGHQGR